MIGFKRTPVRLVLTIFLISVVSILLIYVDYFSNKPLPIEKITISKDLDEGLAPIKSCLLYTSPSPRD